MGAALPLITVAGTVVSGFMSYQQSQTAAAAAEMQASMLAQQAQSQAQLTSLQIQQTQLEAEGQELELRDEANRKRRAARLAQEQAVSQQAGRGLIARPFGSFGAILGDAEAELYRDLESNRMQRSVRQTHAAISMSGAATQGVLAMQTSQYQQAGALADAQTARLQSYQSLAGSLVSAAKIMPEL